VIRNRGDYWQVKVYAGRDLLTGRERYEYDRARTKREAERVEAALKTKVAEGRHRSTAARTVADLVERWYQWRQGVKEISPTTLEGYRRQIDQRIIPALGRIPVRRLDVETLDTFYAELRRRGKDGSRPLSASTVRAVHTVLSGSLRQAVAWGWIAHNPARLATSPRCSAATWRRHPLTRWPACWRPRWSATPSSGCSCGWRWCWAPAAGSCARCAGSTSTWTGVRCCWSAAWCM